MRVDQPQEWKISMDQGFSLTEVLVSLLLMTTTSLALLKQQWQVSQLLNQIYSRANALSQLDNITERFYLGYDKATVTAPFKFYYTQNTSSFKGLTANKSSGSTLNRWHNDHELQDIRMKMTWASSTASCCSMERRFVIGLGHE